MTKVQIVSSKNSAWYLFCSKKCYKNENTIRDVNKMLFENLLFIVFYQKLLAAIIYMNKDIAKAQPMWKEPVEANLPRYYNSDSMNTKA